MKLRTPGTTVVFAAVLVLIPASVVFAHGEPVLRVEPPIAAAGGSITVTGTEMEPGEVFSLVLEGAATSVSLGQVTVEGDGDEGGFEVIVSLPIDLAPGSYRVRASTEAGETAVADLTVTASAADADPGPAMVEEPSGEPHLLDRARSPGQAVGIAAASAASAILGVWLIRRRP